MYAYICVYIIHICVHTYTHTYIYTYMPILYIYIVIFSLWLRDLQPFLNNGILLASS